MRFVQLFSAILVSQSIAAPVQNGDPDSVAAPDSVATTSADVGIIEALFNLIQTADCGSPRFNGYVSDCKRFVCKKIQELEAQLDQERARANKYDDRLQNIIVKFAACTPSATQSVDGKKSSLGQLEQPTSDTGKSLSSDVKYPVSNWQNVGSSSLDQRLHQPRPFTPQNQEPNATFHTVVVPNRMMGGTTVTSLSVTRFADEHSSRPARSRSFME